MITLPELKKEINGLVDKPKFEKMVEFAALVTAYFEQQGIKPVIVGGLSVEIYTRSHYTTRDIDFITDGWERFNLLLTQELGFQRTEREWYHKELEIAVEIPSNFLEGSQDKIMKIKLPSEREIYVIGVEDIIIHRLESAIATNSEHPEYYEDYEWAERMFKIHFNDNIDKDYLMTVARSTKIIKIIEKWIDETI